MPGVVEHTHACAFESCGKLADLGFERLPVEIEAYDHPKAELLQHSAHVSGIVLRVLEPGRVPVGGIADDERDS